MNTTKEAKRLYSCIMHDFHDGKDRQEMWEREIRLVISQQVLQALKEVKGKQQNLWTEMASDGNEYRIKAVPLSAIEQIEEKYR